MVTCALRGAGRSRVRCLLPQPGNVSCSLAKSNGQSCLGLAPRGGPLGGEAALARLAELERERRVADALVQVAEQAGETIDLTLLLDRICRLTVELVPADRATVFLYDNRLQAYVPFADCGSPARVFERFAGRPFFPQSRAGAHRRGVPFRDELVAHGIAHHSREHEPTPEAIELLDELEAYATCQVPLRGSRGSLNVYLERPPDFDETALHIIRGVARQADNLIQRSRLFKKTHDASRVRAGLAGLAAAVNLETVSALLGCP